MEQLYPGLNCAQRMVAELVEDAKENRQLMDAAGALGFGLFAQKTCGVLSGGCCAIAVCLGGDPLHQQLQAELAAWFEARYGAADCAVLRKLRICPQMIAETMEKCADLLNYADNFDLF